MTKKQKLEKLLGKFNVSFNYPIRNWFGSETGGISFFVADYGEAVGCYEAFPDIKVSCPFTCIQPPVSQDMLGLWQKNMKDVEKETIKRLEKMIINKYQDEYRRMKLFEKIFKIAVGKDQ